MLLTLKMFNRGEQRPSTTYQSKSSVVFFFKVQWFPLMALYHVRLRPFAKPMKFFPFSLFAAFLLLCLGVIIISRSYVNRSLRKTPPCGVTLNTTPRTQFLKKGLESRIYAFRHCLTNLKSKKDRHTKLTFTWLSFYYQPLFSPFEKRVISSLQNLNLWFHVSL